MFIIHWNTKNLIKYYFFSDNVELFIKTKSFYDGSNFDEKVSELVDELKLSKGSVPIISIVQLSEYVVNFVQMICHPSK